MARERGEEDADEDADEKARTAMAEKEFEEADVKDKRVDVPGSDATVSGKGGGKEALDEWAQARPGEAATGDSSPDVGQLPGTAGKMVGGGLEAGSTDFGPATGATAGGKTGFGSDSGRSVTSGVGSGGAGKEGGSAGPAGTGVGGTGPMLGAGGTSVTNTGRPMRADERGTIGSPVPSSGGVAGVPGERSQDSTPNLIGGQTRMAGGTTSTGTLGGGTAGTPTDAQRDRAVDVVEGKAALVEGTLPGTGETGLKKAAEGTPQTEHDIGRDARPGKAKE